MTYARQFAPATERNREPIADVLARVLPKTGTLLEIGSGSGQHAVAFAPRFPGLCWQTSDPDPTARASIVAWMEVEQVDAPPPLAIDVEAETWPLARADAVVCINMIHIAPWSSCLGLMAGAGRVLREGGVLYLYGPYRIKGAHTAPSNEAFDQSLRERDPRWGVRDLGDVILAAARHDLAFVERVAMPTNNFSVVFHRSGR